MPVVERLQRPELALAVAAAAVLAGSVAVVRLGRLKREQEMELGQRQLVLGLVKGRLGLEQASG